MIEPLTRSTLFPYTTLFRSNGITVRDDAFNRGIEYLDKTLVEETNNYDQQSWMLHALAASHASLKQTRVSQFQTKRSEEHTSELQSHSELVCRLLLEKKNDN